MSGQSETSTLFVVTPLETAVAVAALVASLVSIAGAVVVPRVKRRRAEVEQGHEVWRWFDPSSEMTRYHGGRTLPERVRDLEEDDDDHDTQ